MIKIYFKSKMILSVRITYSLMLVSTMFLLLSSNAVSHRRDKSIFYSRSAITILVSCFILSLNSLYINFLDNGIGLFHGLFQTNAITHSFHIFIFFISGIILQLNSFYPRKLWTEKLSDIYKLFTARIIYVSSFITNKMSEQFRILEYPLIILFVITGGVFLVCCFDLISIFLAIELQSYGLYLLCSIYRDSEKSTSAGLTYFLLGSLSSCFILLASALIYSNSGNTGFDGLYIINNISNGDIGIMNTMKNIGIYIYQLEYLNISLVIMSTGFLFKVTAAPFHFWSPDVYDAIPTVVTTFVAIFTKISIFVLILELTHFSVDIFFSQEYGLLQQNYSNFVFNNSWTFALLLSSLLSLIIGSILGLTQFRIKRLYAYSTISHVGFILFALAINSVESVQSFIFYIMQYSVANLNAFIILITMGYSLYIYKEKYNSNILVDNIDYNSNADNNVIKEANKIYLENKLENSMSDKENSPMQLISQMKGYFYVNPILCISLGLTVFSLVGVPPLIGFFAKQMLLSSALDNGYVFMALIAIITSVISACYYLALIKQMFFDKSDYVLNDNIRDMNMTYNIVDNIKKTLLGKTINLYGKNQFVINPDREFLDNNLIHISVRSITLSSSLAITISILTFIILFFITNPQECLSITNVLSLVYFNI